MNDFFAKLYEWLFKPKPLIVADTIEMAMRETLYDPALHPDTNVALDKASYTCNAVHRLQKAGKVTPYAEKLTREFLMRLLSPWTTFENYAYENPDYLPTLQEGGTTGEQMQHARRKWLANLVEILRDRDI